MCDSSTLRRQHSVCVQNSLVHRYFSTSTHQRSSSRTHGPCVINLVLLAMIDQSLVSINPYSRTIQPGEGKLLYVSLGLKMDACLAFFKNMQCFHI
jgi:hypothetical protein